MFLLLGVQQILAQNVKTVYIPDNIKAEENSAKETFVHNLSDEKIFVSGAIYAIDDKIYFLNKNPLEIIKLTLQGKVLIRNKNYGEGPGEFLQLFGLRAYNGDIVVQDCKAHKMIFYTKNLEFKKEFRFRDQFLNFFINKKNEFVLCNNSRMAYYFVVINETGKVIRKFGKAITSPAEKRKMILFDTVSFITYLPGKDGIWASFRNRYDLRYYEKEKLVLEIKAKKGYFKAEEQEVMGRKYLRYVDRAVHIAREKDRLYFYYRKDKKIYCDIFNLNNYRLLRRVKFKINYRHITHHKNNVFYALAYEKNEDQELLLFKLEV